MGRSPPRKPNYRGSVPNGGNVAVVGAGFAGLAAALELRDAGLDITVLEARDRVGGRVHSVELHNGEIAELGAEWIFAGDEALQATIDRLGLVACEARVDYLRRGPRGVGAVSEGELDAFLETADAHLATLDRSSIAWAAPEPSRLKRRSGARVSCAAPSTWTGV